MKVLIGRDREPTKKVTLRWLWEPRDIWVGVFWNTVSRERFLSDYLFVYISLLPCLPFCLIVRRSHGV